jgi:hypothetical protein
MRSVVFLGVAAAAVLLPDPVYANENAPRVVIVERGVDYGRAPLDVRVYTSRDDRQITEADYRERWTGDREGQWAPDSASYRGRYGPETVYRYDDDDPNDNGEERVSGGDVYYAPADDYRYAPRYGQRADGPYEMERLCGRDATVGGAVVAGLIGGVAGNRIAGRGNRTEGTIVGAGVGALAGGAIGSAADRQRCETWRAGYPSRGGTRRVMPRRYGDPDYAYGYAYPAYYYPVAPAPVVTTVIVEGGATVTVR